MKLTWSCCSELGETLEDGLWEAPAQDHGISQVVMWVTCGRDSDEGLPEQWGWK